MDLLTFVDKHPVFTFFMAIILLAGIEAIIKALRGVK